MMRLKVAAFWIFGKLLFVLVFVVTSFASCSGVYLASTAVFYPEETDFSSAVPPGFAVVVEDRAAKDPKDRFVVTPLRRVPELLKQRPDMLRLSQKSYSSVEGDPWKFRVTEETPTSQVIELEHRNTHGIKARYRVDGDRITPLSFKTDGGVVLMSFLIPVFLVCLGLGWWAARRSTRWIGRASETARGEDRLG